MADVDINPFSDHDKPDDCPDENIPLTQGGMTKGSTWEPEHKQETSFEG